MSTSKDDKDTDGCGVVAYNKSCPISVSNEYAMVMSNFVKNTFENAINALPKEVNPDFLVGLAEIAKKVVSYKKIDWPWDDSGRLAWFLLQEEESLKKIATINSINQETILITVGVLLSTRRCFLGLRSPKKAMEFMCHISEILDKLIKNRKEAEMVAKYAGKNENSEILLRWFRG